LETPSLGLPLTWQVAEPPAALGPVLSLDESNNNRSFTWKSQDKDNVKPGKILSAVAGLFSIYKKWLKIARNLKRPFYEFAYDWRRDLHETTALFEEFLLKVSSENANSKVQVVAHSMGGLVTFPVLNRQPSLIHSVTFAGVPFGVGIGFLKDLHVGNPQGNNSKILSQSVLFTFPSVYNFFPSKNNPKIFSDMEHPYDIDLMTVKDWIENKLGVFSLMDPTEAMQSHLENCLNHAVHYRNSLQYNPKVNYPPIAILAAKSKPTIKLLLKDGPKSIRGYDFETMPKVEGDSRVTWEGAHPPEGVPHEEFETTESHEALLDDPIIIKILDHLLTKVAKQ